MLRCRAAGKQLSSRELVSFPVLVVFGCFLNADFCAP